MALSKVWSCSNRQLKLRVLHTCALSVATYGCDAWTLRKNISARVNAFENKCYQKLMNVSWTEMRSNESMYEELNVNPGVLFGISKQGKLRFFGHMKRHQCLEKLIVEGKVNGRRGCGRPTRSWDDDVAEWLKIDNAEAGRVAMDRGRYKEAVRAATSLPG